MRKILLAGATGYLGSYILAELINEGFDTRVIARNLSKIDKHVKTKPNIELLKAEVTEPKSIENCCRGIDTVISTVGITNQKDGLTYMDVDYQANRNLLDEAIKHGVRKFIYISVFKGDRLKNIAVNAAKERFVEELKQSGIDYCIVRPNGFFSDMAAFYGMAKKGKIYLFGDGRWRLNPIHGADLAKECVRQINDNEKELNIGGPQIFTQKEIAEMAFDVAGKKLNIRYIPDVLRRIALSVAQSILPKKKCGKIEFFLTASVLEMIAPQYGTRTLRAFFETLKTTDDNNQ